MTGFAFSRYFRCFISFSVMFGYCVFFGGLARITEGLAVAAEIAIVASAEPETERESGHGTELKTKRRTKPKTKTKKNKGNTFFL